MQLLTRIRMKAKAPVCIVCGKPCDPIKDRNTDGSHAHDDCLRKVQILPLPKGYGKPS